MFSRLYLSLYLVCTFSLAASLPGMSLPVCAEEDPLWDDLSENEANHFIIRYRGGENAVAGHIIAILLEEAYISVGADFDYHLDEKVEAFLYSRERFRDITRSPSWAGAIYDGAIKIPAGGITEKTDLLEEVLFHEYTHAVVHRLSKGRAPMWLNEGIAQYEEGKRQGLYREILRDILEQRERVSLRRLEGPFIGLNEEDAVAAYVLSLSATEYLVSEFGVSAVRNILEELGGGRELEDAVFSALYLSYDELEKNWLLSLKRSLGK
ncbi:MAG: peptidase MA family metallohydrolase [Thermodesulfobacteriota bacterium]